MQIRKAKPSDIEAIHSLVYELAVYEKAPEEAVATVAEYQSNFDRAVFDAIVAEENDQIVGMALYYMTFSTWKGRMLYLEDFIVTDAFRGQGIGKQIFQAVIDEAKKLECRLMKWQVLDWNEPAIHFYKKFNTHFEEEWYNVKLIL